MTIDELKDKLQQATQAINKAFELVDDLVDAADPFDQTTPSRKIAVSMTQDDFVHAMKNAATRLSRASDIIVGYLWLFNENVVQYQRNEICEILASINQLESEKSERQQDEKEAIFSIDGSTSIDSSSPGIATNCDVTTSDWDINKEITQDATQSVTANQ